MGGGGGRRKLDCRCKLQSACNFNMTRVSLLSCSKIYETQGLSSRLLAELYTAIPEASVTSQSVQLEEMEFSSDEKIQFAHEGVGSGEMGFCLLYSQMLDCRLKRNVHSCMLLNWVLGRCLKGNIDNLSPLDWMLDSH